MNGRLVLTAAVTVALAGCGDQAVPPSLTAPASHSAPASSSSAPSSLTPSAPAASSPARPATSPATGIPIDPPLSGPPNGPTDNMKKTAWVVGTVATDSSGPCYRLETDEGTQYALHSTAGTKLVKGTRMRIKTAPTKLRIDCGPGKLMEMVSAEALR